MQISGTSAIVTGAASGLGAATARALTEAGAAVIGLDLPGAVDAHPQDVPGLRLVGCDVTSEESVAAAITTIGEDDPPLRIVVNCAGIAPAQRILSSKGVHPLDLFRKTLEVNVVGTFNVLRLAAERIAQTEADAEGQRGLIVNTASVAAFEGQIGQAAYSATKAGLAGMVLPMAREFARIGIRCMAIAPGIFHTPMMDSMTPELRASLASQIPFPSRLGRPEEFAQLVAAIFEIPMLNGETIRLDGAIRMQPK
jgi:NAD(P)-dependent dehydrogenase (short-subunit alcohol dehydrogenase family)